MSPLVIHSSKILRELQLLKKSQNQTNKTPEQVNSNVLVLCRLCKEFQANAWSFLIRSSGAQPALLQYLENSPKTVYIQHKQLRQYNNIPHHFACSLNRPEFKKYEHFN